MPKNLITKEQQTVRSRRTLALSPLLVAALVSHRDRQDFERKRAGSLWQESGLLFISSI